MGIRRGKSEGVTRHAPYAGRSGSVGMGGPAGKVPEHLLGTSPHGGPMQGERGYTLVVADTPYHTCTHSVLCSIARWPGGTPGGIVPSLSGPSCWPGRCALLRSAGGRTGWAEARADLYRPAYVQN